MELSGRVLDIHKRPWVPLPALQENKSKTKQYINK